MRVPSFRTESVITMKRDLVSEYVLKRKHGLTLLGVNYELEHLSEMMTPEEHARCQDEIAEEEGWGWYTPQAPLVSEVKAKP